MSNAFYTASGAPSTGSPGQSSPMRAEFALIQSAFDKFPALSGNDLKVLRVASGGASVEAASVTGTGSVVMSTSPSLTTPNIGAATGTSLSVSGSLTSTVATGTAPLVVSSTTLVPNLYVARAALADTATTNANLTGPITSSGNATSVASQTGTGTKFVMDTSPTLVTPVLGAATATSINKVTLTQPATGSTLTVADGKTLIVSNSLTLAGTDGRTHTFPTTNSTVARTDAGQTFSGAQTIANLIATGGSIDGVAIGATTPAAGTFTHVAEGVNSYAPGAGAGQNIDFANGSSTLTNNGTNAVNFINVPIGMLIGHLLSVTNFNNTTFPASVDWGVGGKPSIAGAADVSLWTRDGAVTVRASVQWQAV